MKRQKFQWLVWLMGLAALGFLLSGCAAGTTAGTGGGPAAAAAPSSIELLLLKAGFETVPDEHPMCAGVCSTLTPGQIVPYIKADKKVYGYLSPETKRLFVGNEGDYQRFINLAVVQKIEERSRPVSDPRTDPQFWTMWADVYGGH